MKIVFMGTPQAAIPTLHKLVTDGHEIVAVYTQPDRPSGRGNKLTSPPVKDFALQYNLPIYQPLKIKTDEALQLFQSHQADFAVVVAYGRILPESFLNAYPNGAINVHFSILPKYRGAAPVNWAIVNGEKTTGVTTMQMDAGLDTGDILLQYEIEIGETENTIDLMDRLSTIGADLLSKTLINYERLAHIPQHHEFATYAPILKKQDGLIDWNLSAQKISNQIRGFQPFPTSFTKLDEKKLTIWNALVSDFESSVSSRGEVIAASGDQLVIGCGQNTFLQIEELQLEGKKRMKTKDFLNGIKIEVGVKLG